MSLRDVDFEAGFRRLAERRIEEAMQEGKFDHLPGAGKPLELEPLPADENARMAWWAIRLLRRNEVIPHEVRWLKQIEALKDELSAARDKRSIIRLVGQINALVHKLNTLGTNALSAGLTKLDLAAELSRLQAR